MLFLSPEYLHHMVEPTRIVDFIFEHASTLPNKIAVRKGEKSLTYSNLCLLITCRAEELYASTERALVLRASQSIDFVVEYLAAHMAHKVVVPLEYDVSNEKFSAITSLVQQAYIPNEVADILFTTGTTGQQKGVMISHQAIIANAENLISSQGFSSDTTFVISGPLNHIGSLSKLWPTFYMGGTIVITEGLKRMDQLFYELENAEGKVATFLVPASIRMLLQLSADRFRQCASSLDFIETGAAAIAQSDMETLCQLLPHTRLYNTYASTETGIVCTHNYNAEGACIAGCLGMPMRHAHVNITEEGNVVCSGPMIMTGYVGDPELTSAIMYDDAIHTADSASIDSEGRLRLKGRQGDVINVGGYKVNPLDVENVAMGISEIKDCICIGAPHPVMGHVLKLLYVLNDGAEAITPRTIAMSLRTQLEAYMVPSQYSEVEAIKRTYNGKIDRKFYQS